MNTESYKKVWLDNLAAVFDAFSGLCRENGSATRSEIANRTGISLMTVGKAADKLVAASLAVQKKEQRPVAGRRRWRLYPAEHIRFAVLDASGERFSLTVTDEFFTPLGFFTEGTVKRGDKTPDSTDKRLAPVITAAGECGAYTQDCETHTAVIVTEGRAFATPLFLPDFVISPSDALFAAAGNIGGRVVYYDSATGDGQVIDALPVRRIRKCDFASVIALTIGGTPSLIRCAAALSGADRVIADLYGEAKDEDFPGACIFRPPLTACVFGALSQLRGRILCEKTTV